jgi:hypothetical protein
MDDEGLINFTSAQRITRLDNKMTLKPVKSKIV